VARIFNLILEGNGLIEIVKQLNSEGIVSPNGKGWKKTTVSNILANEAYTGTLVWGKSSLRDLPPIRVENAWPAIIGRDSFERAHALLKERTPVNLHPKRVASRYLLSGLAKCGYCGKALVGQDAKSGQFSYYICGALQKKGAGSCPTRRLNSQRFENAVINRIKQHVLTADNLAKLVHIVNEEMDSLATEFSQQLDSVLYEITDVDHRLERLYDALETGKIELADLAPRIQQLRTRQQQLQTSRLELEQNLSDRRVELADAETVAKCIV
jgi:site-specific DNA recombinase